MPHAVPLGAEIADVVAICGNLNRNARCDRNAEVRELRYFVGIIGHKAQRPNAEGAEHGGRWDVVPEIVRKAERAVGLDGVEPLFLERIGFQFVEESYTAPLLAEVEEHALTRRLNLPEGALQLFAAVAALRAENIAGHALGVHAAEHRFFSGNIALDEREVFEPAQRIEKAVNLKVTEGTRESSARNFFERVVVALAVANQILDADDAKAFALGKGKQFFGPHHLPVLAHNLAAEAGGFQSREAAEVNGRLGVAAALEDTVRAREEREEMAGAAKIRGSGILGNQFPCGQRALGGADAGCGLDMVNRDQKGGLVVIAVYGGHRRQPELLCIVRSHREADQTARKSGHPIHEFRRGKFGGANQVALVFA